MPSSTLGLVAGLLLAIAALLGGFLGFVLAILLGGGGYLVGAHLDGDLDLSALRGRRG
ncbi:hypothetical protein GCM10022215_17250 [Nocardioides fonticola]|uniref:DUF2273 domain-containing protein n=1 Tax=Nocardioides fonticola TaxID=450363 RepID=A0ABP7XI19_9ACTN